MATVPESSPTPAFNQTAILEGLTDFVVGRIQDDVRAAGFQSFVSKACGNAEESYLPRSCVILKASSTALTLPPLAALREAIREDLKQLPHNFLDNAALHLKASTTPTVRNNVDLAVMATDVGYALLKNERFLDALAQIRHDVVPADYGIDCAQTRSAAMLYELSSFAALVLQGGSYLSADSSTRSAHEGYALKTLVINAQPDTGASAHWPRGGACDRGSRLVDARQLAALIRRMGDAANLVQALATPAPSTPAGAQGTIDTDTRVVETAFDLLGDVLSATPTGQPDGHGLQLISQLKELAVETVRSDYGAALITTLEVSVTATGDTAGDLKKRVGQYLGFAADIAGATDANAVSQALNRIAAPRTSFLRKRSGFYVSLNAYGGIAYGKEVIPKQPFAYTLGPFVPVGVEFGHSVGSNASIGVFAYALDVGALATYRLQQSDSVHSDPTVGFKQVFSPGLGLVLGLTRTIPVTVGWLWRSRSPALRAVTSGGITTQVATTRHDVVFLAFDVPIL